MESGGRYDLIWLFGSLRHDRGLPYSSPHEVSITGGGNSTKNGQTLQTVQKQIQDNHYTSRSIQETGVQNKSN